MEAPDTASPPQPLEEQWPRVRATIADATGILVCLDFDGTLAPIVEDPDDATPTERNQEAVTTLADTPGVTTAVVSGRALSDVRERIDGPSIYAGNHGLELARGGDVTVHPVAREHAARIERLCAVLEVALASVPNCRVENKRLTGTVHFRAVPSAAVPTVRRLTHDIVDSVGGDALELSPGKQILEIGPDLAWGKGDAVEVVAADEPSETAVIYVGDDVTDESAFRTVEPDGLGIRVGSDEPSNASARVASPAAVADFLSWLGSTGVDLLE
ncbi:trehalose-phosphatase [Natrinema hispanicum]|uniref:Trehalose 6-phosphate phosphatase n=1 Tax=Natrinema hispanicum TaxID=392421 RepID=A0A1G6V981_9EURY|nr:trehalose-phosphatase [Natrinema hispanicum]SDD49577.1 trehalose 6-phosphate phosphatase [Natrinema hispanicum]SEU08673.1 trehalose 6-phosphate phosphatase [Natrinema hispanicum]